MLLSGRRQILPIDRSAEIRSRRLDGLRYVAARTAARTSASVCGSCRDAVEHALAGVTFTMFTAKLEAVCVVAARGSGRDILDPFGVATPAPMHSG
jgi:hypothetical protein